MKTFFLLFIAITFTASASFATQTCEDVCDATSTSAEEVFACYDSCSFVPGAAVVSAKGKIVPGAIDGKLSQSRAINPTGRQGKL